MIDSRQLIEDACDGRKPSRPPLFDLLLNDAVIARFAGRPFDGQDDEAVSIAAVGNALDGSRHIAVPDVPGRTWVDEQGNLHEAARWTSWIRAHALTEPEQWIAWIARHIEQLEAAPAPTVEESGQALAQQRGLLARLNGTQFIHCTPSTAINDLLFGRHCGLEMFSYLWADQRPLMQRWLRALEGEQRRYIARAAHRETSGLAMIYSDVAFKHNLMFSKPTFRAMGFFDDVAGICEACHARGLRVIFHSDGNIMPLVDDLVAAGIDGLNPLEKAAGMDVYALRRRHPQLILVGGLDVTHLLPFGTPDEVRRETRRMIDELGSEGRLLIGSSTELGNDVPLENYLAFRDEAMQMSDI
jgi:uroporphyrinogen decarboxylase